MPDQKALSTQQVAAMLHVSCNTVYELIRRGGDQLLSGGAQGALYQGGCGPVHCPIPP